MAKLPDETAIGAPSIAPSGRPIATIDESGYARGAAALGEGAKNLGEGIAKASKDLAVVAKDQENEAFTTAHANLLTKKVELDTEFLDDTDYTDRTKRYQQKYDQIVTDAGSGLSGSLKNKFSAQASILGAQAIERQTQQAQTQGNDAALAHLQTEGEWLINNAIKSPDKETRTAAIDAFNSRVDSLVERKVFNSSKGLTIKQAWARQYATADALGRIDNGDFSVFDEIRAARPSVDIANIDTLQGPARQQAAVKFFVAKGWTPQQAAGIVGGLRGETANLNPTQVHDGGIGFGIAGWNGDRLKGLRDYAKANGSDPSALSTQLEYVDHELRSSESAAGASLSTSQTPDEAGQATLAYFRPKDWNVSGAHPERARYARQIYDSTDIPPAEAQGPGTIYDILKPDQREQLLLRAERAKGAQLLDIQRQDAMAAREARQRSDAAETDYLKRLNPLDGDANNKPVSAAEIVRDNTLTREAQERLSRIVAASGKDHDTSTYGSAFYTLFKQIHLPEDDPNRITDPAVLYPFVTENKGLTLSGMEKLRQEISGKRTPEGSAEAEMKKQFFANAKGQISGSNEGLHIKDPKGDELYLKFMAQTLPLYEKKRAEGVPAAQLLNPDSPDYLGKSIATFKRPMDQWFSDIAHEPATTAPKAFDISNVKTVDDAVKAYNAGQMTKAQADALAIERGWAKPRPQPVPDLTPKVPTSQAPPQEATPGKQSANDILPANSSPVSGEAPADIFAALNREPVTDIPSRKATKEKDKPPNTVPASRIAHVGIRG